MAGGSDADADDEDELEAMGATKLDSDSEEASDTEWRAWMTDLPLQFFVRQTQMTDGNGNSNKTLKKKKGKCLWLVVKPYLNVHFA